MKHKESCKCEFCLGSHNFKEGHKPWNKDLTKETDNRVKSYSKSLEGKKRSDSQKENLSKIKKKLFSEGKLKSWNEGLTKENNLKLAQISKKVSKTKKRLYSEGKIINPNFGKKNKKLSERNKQMAKLKIKNLEGKEKEIIDLYKKDNLSILNLSKKYSCSTTPITRILKERNISIRNSKFYLVNKGFKNRKKINLESDKIINLYKDMSIEKISKLFNCKHGTISNILKANNIKILGSKRICNAGSNNPNWQGGLSFEPYDKNFNNKFKRAIRKRDNQICLKCLKHQEKLPRTLNVHHINYDKLMSLPQNCCALCNKCNSEVNFNRIHWTKFFQSLLSEKYGYEYAEGEKIILKIGEEDENKKFK